LFLSPKCPVRLWGRPVVLINECRGCSDQDYKLIVEPTSSAEGRSEGSLPALPLRPSWRAKGSCPELERNTVLLSFCFLRTFAHSACFPAQEKLLYHHNYLTPRTVVMANSVGSLAAVARNNKLSTCTLHKVEVYCCLETDTSMCS
jgi:hypothetical protein